MSDSPDVRGLPLRERVGVREGSSLAPPGHSPPAGGGVALGLGAFAGIGRASSAQAAPGHSLSLWERTVGIEGAHGRADGVREAEGEGPLDPIPVRLAEVVHEGPAFRDGMADGVSVPGLGGAWTLTAEATGASYTSPPFELIFPCSHVGVHWRGDSTESGQANGLQVEVRSGRDGARWSGWRRVLVEAHGRDDASNGALDETFGALVGGRQGTWLQYRLTFGEGWPREAGIQRVTLTYLDAGRTPRERLGRQDDGSTFAKAGGLAGFLQRVIPREVWGADESLRFKDGKDQWPRAFVSPKFMAVHHTATDNTYADPAAEIRAIYVYHTVTQGWGDIGYHMLIDNRGQVYEGRLGRESDPDDPSRREIVSRDVVAGHATSHNYGSVGIAVLGNFMDEDPSAPAFQTLEEALTFTASRYALDPRSQLDFLRGGSWSAATDLWHDNLNALSGHRDCVTTECPGDRLYARLPALREAVAAQIGPAGPRVRFTQAPAERTLWPTDLGFVWQGLNGASEYSVRLEGWRLSDLQDIITPLTGYEADQRPFWGPWTGRLGTTFALPPDARGHYTMMVRARDAAGREGAYVERWPLFVDRHVLVDDADPNRTSRRGDWRTSRAILQFNGTGYAEAEPASVDATTTFTWMLGVPDDGTYRVLACWTDGDNRATNAQYTISAGGQQLASVQVNQQERGATWVELARVPLQAGAACEVTLSNEADGVVIADAVRLVLV